MNIDDCRVPAKQGEYDIRHYTNEDCFQNLKPKESKFQVKAQPSGRFPANVILTYDETDKEEVCEGFPIGGQNGSVTKKYEKHNRVFDDYHYCNPFDAYEDSGSASRYFYCAKASPEDRDEGLEGFKMKKKVFNGKNDKSSENIKDDEERFTTYAKNYHPTVKPTKLMQYLVRLVTPKDGIVLDPFMGSGSTGKAVLLEDLKADRSYSFIGVEKEEEYFKIAEARINGIKNKYRLLLANKI